jgi:hypothetical protein
MNLNSEFIKVWGNSFYELFDKILIFLKISFWKSQSITTIGCNVLPFTLLFLLLIPGIYAFRFSMAVASRTLFLPIFRFSFCTRHFTLRLSHVLIVLSTLHSIAMYSILVEPHIQSVQRDLSIFGKRELVNLARNFIEVGIAFIGTFLHVVTWRIWGLGNSLLEEKLKEPNDSIAKTSPPPIQKTQQQQQPQMQQSQTVSNVSTNADGKEESKRLSNISLPTSVSKRPMAPLNHQYGFLSPSTTNQHLD